MQLYINFFEMDLTRWSWLTLNSERSNCLCLSVEIKGVQHQARPMEDILQYPLCPIRKMYRLSLVAQTCDLTTGRGWGRRMLSLRMAWSLYSDFISIINNQKNKWGINGGGKSRRIRGSRPASATQIPGQPEIWDFFCLNKTKQLNQNRTTKLLKLICKIKSRDRMSQHERKWKFSSWAYGLKV